MTSQLSDIYDATGATATIANAIDALISLYESNGTSSQAGSVQIGHMIIGNSVRFYAYPRRGQR